MNFFQFLDTYPWVSVAAFAAIQLWFFFSTQLKLNELSHFFPSKKWETYGDEEHLTLIAEPEDSKNAQELVKEINDYITKTNGAVEYAVIKDKTERRIDSLYEFATSKISFPTYLGLMGTFFGVYIGLKCFNAGLGQGDGGITDQMVKELIGGIIVSMVTSLVGLVLMTISNIHASNVQKKVDTQKDEFFEFLQMSVIPTLGTNVSSSLNRLRSTIGNFEPSFRAVIEEFKAAFRDCTDMFKGTFAENAEVLTKAVAEMGSNMTLINENIQKQDQLLTTLRQRDMVTTLDKFVTAANSFDSVTTSIQKLEEAKERIIASTNTLADKQETYNKSLEIPTRLLQQVNSILDRVTTFEQSINALGVNIAQTQLLGNTQINAIEAQLSALKTKTAWFTGIRILRSKNLTRFTKSRRKLSMIFPTHSAVPFPRTETILRRLCRTSKPPMILSSENARVELSRSWKSSLLPLIRRWMSRTPTGNCLTLIVSRLLKVALVKSRQPLLTRQPLQMFPRPFGKATLRLKIWLVDRLSSSVLLLPLATIPEVKKNAENAASGHSDVSRLEDAKERQQRILLAQLRGHRHHLVCYHGGVVCRVV